MAVAIDALEAAFTSERPETPLRSHVEVPGGKLLLMPAGGVEGAGIKLITVNDSNPDRGLPLLQGAYVLFAPDTLAPEAVIEGSALTGIRTAAVSGLATRHLARPGAARLVLFGAGIQAHAHLEAMAAVLPISTVTVVSRTMERAERLAERARSMGLDATIGEPDAVADADIVCTCTTSPDPVFDGSLLAAGAHVNAVGSYQPHTRELDDAVMARAKIVVETKATALEEAGDVIIPIHAGLIAERDVTELGAAITGAPVRRSRDDVTVFKSVGVAFEDLAVARAAILNAPLDRSPG
jgi:ornithine cyclodeaminase/alanine dehydrogenase-like protein (mu-crystallin family)